MIRRGGFVEAIAGAWLGGIVGATIALFVIRYDIDVHIFGGLYSGACGDLAGLICAFSALVAVALIGAAIGTWLLLRLTRKVLPGTTALCQLAFQVTTGLVVALAIYGSLIASYIASEASITLIMTEVFKIVMMTAGAYWPVQLVIPVLARAVVVWRLSKGRATVLTPQS